MKPLCTGWQTTAGNGQAGSYSVCARAESGDLPEHTDTQALGDYVATLLHGISVQARDGVSRDRLLAMTEIAMHMFDLMTASPATH